MQMKQIKIRGIAPMNTAGIRYDSREITGTVSEPAFLLT